MIQNINGTKILRLGKLGLFIKLKFPYLNITYFRLYNIWSSKTIKLFKGLK